MFGMQRFLHFQIMPRTRWYFHLQIMSIETRQYWHLQIMSRSAEIFAVPLYFAQWKPFTKGLGKLGEFLPLKKNTQHSITFSYQGSHIDKLHFFSIKKYHLFLVFKFITFSFLKIGQQQQPGMSHDNNLCTI